MKFPFLRPLPSLTSLSLAFGLLGGAAPEATAQRLEITQQCRWVRQVRVIVIESGSTARRLYDLEYDYCRGRRRQNPQTDTRSNCFHLTMMQTLAQTGGVNTQAIAAERVAACAFPDAKPAFPWRYANGQVVKRGSSWYYPNGETAKFGTRWRYPNGQTATEGSLWRYPNGRLALHGDRGHRPNGGSVNRLDLLRWACGTVGARACENTLTAVAESAEPLQDAAIVKLAWQATRF